MKKPLKKIYGHCVDHFKTQEMCEKVIEKDSPALHYVPDCLTTPGMFEKQLKNGHGGCAMSLTTLKHKKCVKEWLKWVHGS